MTDELYQDIMSQWVVDKHVDLYTPRIDGFLHDIKELSDSQNKFFNLKCGMEQAEQAALYGTTETLSSETERMVDMSRIPMRSHVKMMDLAGENENPIEQ